MLRIGTHLPLLSQFTSTPKPAPVSTPASKSILFPPFSPRRETRLPVGKTHLSQCVRRKVCRQFREGQNLHNYYFDAWLQSNFTQPLVKVRCFVKDKQEP